MKGKSTAEVEAELRAAGKALSPIWSVVNNFLKEQKISDVLLWTCLASLPPAFLQLALVTHANRALGADHFEFCAALLAADVRRVYQSIDASAAPAPPSWSSPAPASTLHLSARSSSRLAPSSPRQLPQVAGTWACRRTRRPAGDRVVGPALLRSGPLALALLGASVIIMLILHYYRL